MGQFYLSLSFIILLLSQSSLSFAQKCNGHAEFCSRSYAAISFPTTHNSFSYSKVPNPAANQFVQIPDQLNDGIRGFMLDAHKPPAGFPDPDGIQLCHTDCRLINAGKAVDTLRILADFLRANPTEVISIIWENFGDLEASKFQTAYKDAGLEELSYVQPAGQQTWPTLGELVASNKRVISFIDDGASDSVPWLLDQFRYLADTPFSNTDLNSWKCVVDRPQGGSLSNIGLYNVNHFLYLNAAGVLLPRPVSAPGTNGLNLRKHAEDCKNAFGHIPNFISVDFYNKGSDNVNIFTVVNELNGVQSASGHRASGHRRRRRRYNTRARK